VFASTLPQNQVVSNFSPMALPLRCSHYTPPLASSSSSSFVRFSPPNFLQFTLPALGFRSRYRFNHRWSLTAVTASSLSTVDSVETSGSQYENKKLLLEVKDLMAVIAESRQQILKGVSLSIYEGEVG
jgi:Fe-S cluster assembly ATP-binding protein